MLQPSCGPQTPDNAPCRLIVDLDGCVSKPSAISLGTRSEHVPITHSACAVGEGRTLSADELARIKARAERFLTRSDLGYVVIDRSCAPEPLASFVSTHGVSRNWNEAAMLFCTALRCSTAASRQWERVHLKAPMFQGVIVLNPSLLVLIAIGTIAGILSGLFGIGGGVVIVPALIYLAGFDQHLATGTSLAVLLPPIGLGATLEYYRHGGVHIKAAIVIALALLISAWLAAAVANKITGPYLRVAFGLFVTGLGLALTVDATRHLK